jgi:hypothetical protein
LGLRLDKNLPKLERDLRLLLHDLCVDWGLCIPPVDQERIAHRKTVTAREFAIEVLRAEGLDPECERQWVRKIAGRFVQHFDAEEVTTE